MLLFGLRLNCCIVFFFSEQSFLGEKCHLEHFWQKNQNGFSQSILQIHVELWQRTKKPLHNTWHSAFQHFLNEISLNSEGLSFFLTLNSFSLSHMHTYIKCINMNESFQSKEQTLFLSKWFSPQYLYCSQMAPRYSHPLRCLWPPFWLQDPCVLWWVCNWIQWS